MCGFIAQLVEHRTGIAEVTGSNPFEALIFSGFFFPVEYYDDHSSLLLTTHVKNRQSMTARGSVLLLLFRTAVKQIILQ